MLRTRVVFASTLALWAVLLIFQVKPQERNPGGGKSVPGAIPSTAVALDRYGGIKVLVSPKGATGFWRVERFGNRWLFVTPEGHGFWMLGVYMFNATLDGGPPYDAAIRAKYATAPGGANAAWAKYNLQRFKAYGFNVLGMGASEGSWNTLPVTTYGTPPPAIKVPFIRTIQASDWAIRGGAAKNLFAGTDQAGVPGIYEDRDLVDMFDPAWAKWLRAIVAKDDLFTPKMIPPTESWMIGTNCGDADYLYGFGSGPNAIAHSSHTHPGWMIAVTAPTQATNPQANNAPYADKTVYTKKAWHDFLVQKYGTIQALNSAWGSNYTTFDSDGGWPNGNGLMDENGRHSHDAWLGDYNKRWDGTTGSLAFVADIDTFLEMMADQFFKVFHDAVKASYPNHLLFGPGSFNPKTRLQILRAMGKYLDVIETYIPPTWVPLSVAAYETSGKPLILWTTLMSQADSDTKEKKDSWGPGYDYPTQEARGAAYEKLVSDYLNANASDRAFPIMGLNWWEWIDKVTQGENANFGLISQHDNAYDGKEDKVAVGKDRNGFLTSGEAKDHGDFVSSVIKANSAALATLAGLSPSPEQPRKKTR